MKARSVATWICQRTARLLSLAVSAYGLVPLIRANFQQDPLLISLYCFLPILSFPVTLLSIRWLRLSVVIHWILALVYLTAFSMLDWRTCTAYGYCEGVPHTVIVTLSTWRAQGVIAVAVLNLALLFLKADTHKENLAADGTSEAH
jgi:hypothetical protein